MEEVKSQDRPDVLISTRISAELADRLDAIRMVWAPDGTIATAPSVAGLVRGWIADGIVAMERARHA